MMKTYIYGLFLLPVLILGLSGQSALAKKHVDNAKEEMAIQHIYVPEHGFDDNDNVSVVLDVLLPDPCYMLADTKIEKNQSTHELRITQYAWRRSDGVCGGGDWLGDSSATVDVNIGRLDVGSYKLVGTDNNKHNLTRVFSVDKAQAATIDSFNYASITGINAENVNFVGHDVIATISGLMASACDKIADPIKVERQGDVIVVMPVAIPGTQDCRDTGSRSFKKTLNLGALPIGDYLLHVRSTHGQVKTQMVYVVAEP